MQSTLVPVAESLPVLANQRRRHRRIAETRVVTEIWPTVAGDIALCRLKSIVKALLCRG